MSILRLVPPQPPPPKREAVCAFCEATFAVELRQTSSDYSRVYHGDCATCGAAAVFTYVAPVESAADDDEDTSP